MHNSSETTRHSGIDAARALGIILMYYGHFVEQIMYLGNPVAASQYKWIYSFHMIFFFIISGWTGGRKDPSGPFRTFLAYRLVSRLIPYFVFCALLALLAQVIPGWYPLADVRTGAGFMKATISTLLGLPLFNIPMWFVGALVMVECCHYWVMRLGDYRKIAGLTLALLAGGLILNAQIFFFEKGMLFWLFNEVPVAYAFYALGAAMAKFRILERSFTPVRALVLGLGCLLLVFLTYDLNQGPFRIIQAVVILLGSHGQAGWFVLTSLAGSCMLLAFGQLLAANAALAYLGRNALVLLGMNGVFYHFLNTPLAAWYHQHMPGNGWVMLLVSVLVTTACLAASVPMIWFANTFVAQLFGKPKQKGPLLPALWK